MPSMYCQPSDIASFLRLRDQRANTRLVFSTSTDPTLEEMESEILRVSNEINRRLGTSYGVTFNEEICDCYPNFESPLLRPQPVVLSKTFIKTFDKTKGDYIQIWKDNKWQSVLDNWEEGTEYSINYDSGIIYFMKTPDRVRQAVKVGYHYGVEINSNEILINSLKDICIKLVSAWYIDSDFYKVGLPYGEHIQENYTISKNFKEEAYNSLKELMTPKLINYRI